MKADKPLFFTKHILKRMAKRGISKLIIQAVVDNGEWKRGKEPFSIEIEYKGVIVVIYEQKNQYNVCTCKLNRENTIRAEELKNKRDIDFWKATHIIIKEIDFSEEIANIS